MLKVLADTYVTATGVEALFAPPASGRTFDLRQPPHAAVDAEPLPEPRPGLFRRIGLWLELRRERRHLAELDDRELEDIGLTRADVRLELSKPFWNVEGRF